jgi:hypothetical protein
MEVGVGSDILPQCIQGLAGLEATDGDGEGLEGEFASDGVTMQRTC